MGEVTFCTTNDGSAGLFNKTVDDIYHSSYGAYSESYEKFLKSSGFLDFIKENDEVSILDICYGIGYNTKTALDEILKLEKIIDIKIDALEYDKKLVHISPILKYQKIDNVINEFIINNSNLTAEFSIFELIKIMYEMKGEKFINWHNILKLGSLNSKIGGFLYPLAKLIAFQHNIYYNYITKRFKKGQKYSKLAKTSLKFYFDDARKSILGLQGKYDFIFLDAFTPKKLPTLWSYEFFKELYRLLDSDGVLVTYSSSAAVRGAMLEAGFFIGSSLDENNKRIGTIATKNKNLIKTELSEFDLSLIKTKAGIFYRDENLNASKEHIISNRENEVQNSNRMTSSRFKKLYEKQEL